MLLPMTWTYPCLRTGSPGIIRPRPHPRRYVVRTIEASLINGKDVVSFSPISRYLLLLDLNPLPVIPAARSSQCESSNGLHMKNDSNKTPSVLVVEDDPSLLRFLTQALKVSGYGAASAASAAAARQVIEQERVDLAIIDIGLPDADGIALGQSFATDYGIPFIHLTGQIESEAVERAARSGAITYLVKPVSIEQLSAAVATALNRAGEINKLMRSVEKLSGDFEDKKSVSIAVGIVMERFGLTEDEAFEVLRYSARSHQEKLQTLAERLIAGQAGLELMASLNKYLRKFEPSRKPTDS